MTSHACGSVRAGCRAVPVCNAKRRKLKMLYAEDRPCRVAVNLIQENDHDP